MQQTQQVSVLVLLLVLGGTMLVLVACSGSSGSETAKTCNFPTVLENPPGGSTVFQCGDGSIIECHPGSSCAFASGAGGDASSGNPNSGNTSDSGNPTDSNNRTTNNVNPTPTPERSLVGR